MSLELDNLSMSKVLRLKVFFQLAKCKIFAVRPKSNETVCRWTSGASQIRSLKIFIIMTIRYEFSFEANEVSTFCKTGDIFELISFWTKYSHNKWGCVF